MTFPLNITMALAKYKPLLCGSIMTWCASYFPVYYFRNLSITWRQMESIGSQCHLCQGGPCFTRTSSVCNKRAVLTSQHSKWWKEKCQILNASPAGPLNKSVCSQHAAHRRRRKAWPYYTCHRKSSQESVVWPFAPRRTSYKLFLTATLVLFKHLTGFELEVVCDKKSFFFSIEVSWGLERSDQPWANKKISVSEHNRTQRHE